MLYRTPSHNIIIRTMHAYQTEQTYIFMHIHFNSVLQIGHALLLLLNFSFFNFQFSVYFLGFLGHCQMFLISKKSKNVFIQFFYYFTIFKLYYIVVVFARRQVKGQNYIYRQFAIIIFYQILIQEQQLISFQLILLKGDSALFLIKQYCCQGSKFFYIFQINYKVQMFYQGNFYFKKQKIFIYTYIKTYFLYIQKLLNEFKKYRYLYLYLYIYKQIQK
eukprot:TRINITY_DN2821_c2_g1_i1.p2 TRINITY_DN2821_c2_g1~~TRINITY_DN2821_c2_g1_i1.p2  ORF type:complete len:218 (-),score=-18.32 TRINITY_DN2821_c2_g1_i1:266-919(-)